MIIPLKRVTILVLQNAKTQALEKLAALGLLHPEIDPASETPLRTNAREQIAAASRAQTCIQAAAAAAAKGNAALEALTLRRAAFPAERITDPLLREVNAHADAYLDAQEKSLALRRTISRYEPFGSFSPDQAEALREKGVAVTLFTANLRDEMPVPEKGFLEVLSISDELAYGVAIGCELPPSLTPLPLPSEPLAETRSRYTATRKSLLQAARALAAFASSRAEASKAACAQTEEQGAYADAFSSMPVSGPVAHISGYMDARKTDALLAAARENGWGVAIRDPEAEENPPTLLETPRIFRPITALFSALNILPGYRETDVSVPFYIFFTIFFAMLIGDAGYALITFALTLLAHRALRKGAKAKGKELPPVAKSAFTLLYVFSAATLAWGVLSGTYFGVPVDWLPKCVSSLPSIQWLGNQDRIMQLCFTLGAIHLSIARIWNAIGLMPDTKALAEIGWVGVIWGMYCVICGIVISDFTRPDWVLYLMAVSILLIVLFMLHKDELKEGAISLGMLPLNVISSMGDIISYVRLYAVGLASVQVAQNFDQMALGLELPLAIRIPAMVLILVLGHLINYAMGWLSILVHAVRLNTLEFSGAKGVTWSGYEFKPFTARSNGTISTQQNLTP